MKTNQFLKKLPLNFRLNSSVFLILILLFSPLTLAASQKIILLTGFNAFGRSSQNQSEEILKEFSPSSPFNRQLNSEGIQIFTCLLPTSYSKAFSVFKMCFDKMPVKPNFILSLGETSDTCRNLDLETQAQNLDNSIEKDNDGITRMLQKINPTGPNTIDFTLTSFLQKTQNLGNKINISSSMGNFVCNHFAYETQSFLKNAHKDILFAFMHTPSQTQSCMLGRIKPAKAAVILTQIFSQL